MALRLRDIPAVPLLALLHLFFTVSSLFLRIYELLTTPDTNTSESDDRLTISAAASVASSPSLSGSQASSRKEANPPKHVGMVISAPRPFISPPSSDERGGYGRGGEKRWTGEQRMRMIECVLNLVELAAEEGVKEVSLYDRSGESDRDLIRARMWEGRMTMGKAEMLRRFTPVRQGRAHSGLAIPAAFPTHVRYPGHGLWRCDPASPVARGRSS